MEKSSNTKKRTKECRGFSMRTNKKNLDIDSACTMTPGSSRLHLYKFCEMFITRNAKPNRNKIQEWECCIDEIVFFFSRSLSSSSSSSIKVTHYSVRQSFQSTQYRHKNVPQKKTKNKSNSTQISKNLKTKTKKKRNCSIIICFYFLVVNVESYQVAKSKSVCEIL